MTINWLKRKINHLFYSKRKKFWYDSSSGMYISEEHMLKCIQKIVYMGYKPEITYLSSDPSDGRVRIDFRFYKI